MEVVSLMVDGMRPSFAEIGHRLEKLVSITASRLCPCIPPHCIYSSKAVEVVGLHG